MANPTGAFGLRPVRHFNGAPWNGAVVPCYVGSDMATALFIGDPVLLTTDIDDQHAYPTEYSIMPSAGTSGIIVRGAIVAFSPLYTDLSKIYNPASTERIAYVCMGHDVVFQIRGDGSGTPLVSWVGANAEMVATGAGSTITGLSGFHLDETTPADTQAFPLHIVGIANQSDNEFGDNTIWEVILNTSLNATGDILGVVSA